MKSVVKVNRALIAREAGVTGTVVSAVLNGHASVRVSAAKRDEILKLVRRYNYVPNKTARSLAFGRTHTIGLLVSRLTPYYAMLTEALQSAAQARGVDVLPLTSGANEELEEQHLANCCDGRVDGVITAGSNDHSLALRAKYTRPPHDLIMVLIRGPTVGFPTVHFDDVAAGRMAADHLLDLGRTVFCVMGTSGERVRSFRERVSQRVAWPPERVETPEYFKAGLAAAERVLALRPLPDGVFACNDLLGLALMHAAQRRGVRVPDDLAIVSCDNTEACLYPLPQLTSIDTQVALTAETALQKLVDRIEGRVPEQEHTVLPVTLCVRGSTVSGAEATDPRSRH
ncbi:MAG: LacI family transcriptional regulator [Candidatus Marinimicrobia bacterium]|nr:LacI family transcriptional regulator [Candidatus Neomarinimicrobiota bacterium]